MSAFKQLLASDIIVSPFEVNKAFTFTGVGELTGSNVGIDRFLGQNIENLFTLSDATTGNISTEYKRLIYNSAKQLYYTNYLSSSYGSPASVPYIVPGATPAGDMLIGSSSSAGRFDNYLQSTLPFRKYYPTGSNSTICVISIPSKLYGDKISPLSFYMTADSNTVYDDGEGNLVLSASNEICGNIFYSHGIAVITSDSAPGEDSYGAASYGSAVYGLTDANIVQAFATSSNVTCSFSSSFTLFETQYKCTVDTSEFNFSQNPSLISRSTDGILYDFVTGSYFNPYVTTVGLYNENQDLIAVGKLAKPLPTNNTTDLTILINIDR